MNDEHTTRRKTLKSPVFADRGLHGFFNFLFSREKPKRLKTTIGKFTKTSQWGLTERKKKYILLKFTDVII